MVVGVVVVVWWCAMIWRDGEDRARGEAVQSGAFGAFQQLSSRCPAQGAAQRGLVVCRPISPSHPIHR